jgi:hypothetical protein
VVICVNEEKGPSGKYLVFTSLEGELQFNLYLKFIKTKSKSKLSKETDLNIVEEAF